eukprot:1009812-Amphidinium_carterae.1
MEVFQTTLPSRCLPNHYPLMSIMATSSSPLEPTCTCTVPESFASDEQDCNKTRMCGEPCKDVLNTSVRSLEAASTA